MGSNLALEIICGIKLTSLTRLKITRIKGLKCLPDWLFSSNRNLTKLEIISCKEMTHLVPHLGGGGPSSLLRKLYIWGCSSLRELPDDLNSLNSLESLSVIRCPDLKSIPYQISSSGGVQQQPHGFTSLRHLCIWKCEGLTNLSIETVESCAHSLERLTLRELSSITNFPTVIGCLHKMTRLRDLVIEGVPMFSTKKIIGSLQYLAMGPFSSSNIVSFNETVGAMLPQLISLRSLHLNGMEHWECLTDQLQHLTSLEELYLEDFGMEALPEWFGNLESLEILALWKCKRLRNLPSKQAMQRLSKLTRLLISGCRLLLKEKRSNNDDDDDDDDDEVPQIVDSEWPKISHIQKVYVESWIIT